MQECRYCKNIIKDNEAFCKYCGYDPKTDTIHPNFIRTDKTPPSRRDKKAQRMYVGGVSPGVKKFAFLGILILVFSIFYKNDFNINNVISDVKYQFTMLLKGKFKFWWQDKRHKKIEWIDVRNFKF